MSRLTNRLIAKVFTAMPWLARRAAASIAPMSFETIPWVPLEKPLAECRVSLVTTGGVHMRTESPFDMADTTGDPTFRVIPATAASGEVMITHDYYDHRDADRDLNIVFPLDRLKEFVAEGRLGPWLCVTTASWDTYSRITSANLWTGKSPGSPR